MKIFVVEQRIVCSGKPDHVSYLRSYDGPKEFRDFWWTDDISGAMLFHENHGEIPVPKNAEQDGKQFKYSKVPIIIERDDLTPLEQLKRAFDKMGINYAVGTEQDSSDPEEYWTYIVLRRDDEPPILEGEAFQQALMGHFFEFDPEGNIGSY